MATKSTYRRRELLAAALAGTGGVVAATTGAARAETLAPEPDKAKVVYHLADLDKVIFALGNIRHHYEGMGGPGKVTIALIVHGPALHAFRASGASREVAAGMAEFARNGLAAAACIHSMQAQNLTLKDLLLGFTVAERGGVVRIAELQALGYAYLRP